MMEERKRILKMVEEGKLSAQEAEKLLNALEKQEPSSALQKTGPHAKKFRWLKIYVKDEDDTVNIKIPWPLIKLSLSLIPSRVTAKLSGHQIDLKELVKGVEEGVMDMDSSELISVESEKGEVVKIWLE